LNKQRLSRLEKYDTRRIDQYMFYKIIYSYTTFSLLEVLVLFVATCFSSYTEPSIENHIDSWPAAS